MIAWLAPSGFFALTALAVPLLIHWMRRSDRRLVAFAAMRYLRETPHPRENRIWHERLLLLLRLLLIAMLALLLAWPVWRRGDAPPPQARWVAVAPGIDASAAAEVAIDTPVAAWHWLAPGPAITSQLREIDAALAPGTAVTVLVPEDLGGLDAERLRLAHAVDWRALPGHSPAASGGDAASDVAASDVAAPTPNPLMLAVRSDTAGAAELGVVRAVAAAWAAAGTPVPVDYANDDAALPPPTAWLVWLGGPLPPRVDAWIRAGGRALASRQPDHGGEAALSDDAAVPIFRERRLGRGRLLSLAAPLRPDAVPALRDSRFPQELRALLSQPNEPPDRAPAESVVPTLSVATTVSGPRAAAESPPANLGRAPALAPPLAFAAALLFCIERAYATRRRP